jgi:hypothetical protein
MGADLILPAVLACIIFFGSLIIIFSEKLHRSITAIAGGALIQHTGALIGHDDAGCHA